MSAMTDSQVRAELERIDPAYARSFPHSSLHQKELYRLLAESQQALGEIIERGCFDISPGLGVSDCPVCKDHIEIAHNARKGGSNA